MYKIDINGKNFLEIDNNVIDFLYNNRQKNFFSYEISGQLFGRVCGNVFLINQITKTTEAYFSFYRVIPNRIQEQNDINDMFTKGYHYLGDWHSHPQAIPQISKLDEVSVVGCFKKSTHSLPFFFHIIIGKEKFNVYTVDEIDVNKVASFDYI